jgi:hypothetical protein
MNKILLLLIAFLAFGNDQLIAHNIGKNKTDKSVDNFAVAQWNVLEITLISNKAYTDPFNQVDVYAVFSGPGGKTITRPAFWDGGKIWKIRFAPTLTGEWKMVTSCNNLADRGLHKISRSIKCNPYSGNLDIYKHGFLKASEDRRYFVYDDGTPFFYLGDTHWLYIHERFDTSNVKGVPSQFKYVVDKRVSQGFTVYQSEAIQHPHGHDPKKVGDINVDKGEEPYCNFRNGFNENDIAGFKNIDRKFAYLAEKGLVHANSCICWALDPSEYRDVYTEAYMAKLGKYWAARYGAYPVLWTIAQEIDKNMYKNFDSVSIGKWFSAAKSIADNDAYHHPLTAHMENTSSTLASDSWWGSKDYHNWWAVQWQEGINSDITPVAKDFWDHTPAKPSVLYESPYEGFWTDAKGARGAGYKAFQCGIYGYGYGANGIWNDLYSIDPPDFGTGYEMPVRYLNWYEGANLPGAGQLIFFKKFYNDIKWWKQVPRFDDKTWGEFADKNQSLISTNGQDTYVVYFFNRVPSTGTLKNLQKNISYTAKWFNTRSGTYTIIAKFETADGNWKIPDKPDSEDWILLVEKNQV